MADGCLYSLQPMMRSWVIVLLGVALLVRADEPADKLTAQGIAEFTAAYEAWDGARFGAAAKLFRQAGALAPNVSTHAYWLGAAEFHRMLQLRNPPPGSKPLSPGHRCRRTDREPCSQPENHSDCRGC